MLLLLFLLLLPLLKGKMHRRIIIQRTRNNLEHFKDGRSNGQIYLRAYIYVKKYEIILLLKQHTKNEIKKKIRRWLPVGCWQVALPF